MNPELQMLDGEFSIHWLDPEADIPAAALNSEFCWTAHTPEELSLVCPSRVAVPAGKTESGWSCIKVRGPLPFQLTGILARLTGTLADAGIGVFAISTFDTDYLLVKSSDLAAAQKALIERGYVFAGEVTAR